MSNIILPELHDIYLSKMSFTWDIWYLPDRAHHTCKKQGDLTSPSENMREKWRHDRETSTSFIETCFCKNVFFFTTFEKKMYLKCTLANILLISFIFNFKFMFCTCIIVVDLIFVDFRYYSFRIEICNITSKCVFPPFVSIKMLPCLKLNKLIVYLWESYK